MDFKRIPIYIDIETGSHVDADGNVIAADAALMRLVYAETCIICATFVRVIRASGIATLVPVALPINATFYCGGDIDFDETSSLMFYSGETAGDDNRVNLPGDWHGGDTADKTLGQVSFRINTRTSRFSSVLGEKFELAGCYFVVGMIPAGQTEQSVLANFKFKAINRVTSETGAPAPEDPTYLDAQQIQALFAAAPAVQFSPDGLTDWNGVQRSTDRYLHMSFDGGAHYGIAIQIPTGLTGPQGEGLQIDDTGTLAERAAHDGEAAGYTYLCSDDSKYYRKQSATSGDWSTGVLLKATNGTNGLSAYEIWLVAGHTGTEDEFLAWLQGDPGAAAPQVLIQYSTDTESWHDAYISTDAYIHFSTDNGDTWGPTVRIRGLDGVGIQGVKGDKGDTGDGLHADTVGDYSDIVNYDDQDAGFMFLASNTACLYRKQSAAAGDWSDAINLKGADGTAITIGATQPANARIGDFHIEKTGVAGEMLPLFYRTRTGWITIGNLRGTGGSKGDPGANAPQVLVQLSADGETWHDHADAGESDNYIHFSTNGGTAWGPAIYFRGTPGDSAYQTWLDAGNEGTEADFLSWLRGGTRYPFTAEDVTDSVITIAAGLNVVAVIDESGKQWFFDNEDVVYGETSTDVSLAGIMAMRNITAIPGTWQLVLAGGEKGTPGQDAKSTYEIWLDAGNEGTEADYIAWLVATGGSTAEMLAEHAADTIKHITAAERTSWNSKASGTHNHDGVYAPVSHTHTIANVTGLESALTGKADAIRDFDMTTLSGAYTPAWTDGDFQRGELTGDMTLSAPTTIPASGLAMMLEITVSSSYSLILGSDAYTDGIFLVTFYRSGSNVRTQVREA